MLCPYQFINFFSLETHNNAAVAPAALVNLPDKHLSCRFRAFELDKHLLLQRVGVNLSVYDSRDGEPAAAALSVDLEAKKRR